MVTCHDCGKKLGNIWVKEVKEKKKQTWKQQDIGIPENILNFNRALSEKEKVPAGYTSKNLCYKCYNTQEDQRRRPYKWARKKFFERPDTSTKSRVARFK